jgi:hypothetical protein
MSIVIFFLSFYKGSGLPERFFIRPEAGQNQGQERPVEKMRRI